MYLSKVVFKQGGAARQALLNLQKNGQYASHQLLWELFPEEKERNFLFREELNSSSFPYYYLFSKEQPSQHHNSLDIHTKIFKPRIFEGDKLAFKLRVNPTKTISHENKKNGTRHDVMLHAKKQAQAKGIENTAEVKKIMLSSAVDWLMNEKRQDAMGVELLTVPDVESYQYKTITKRRDNNKFSFSMVDYQGVLQVKNVDKLLHLLQQGIGKSKAFGCGLMLIKPM